MSVCLAGELCTSCCGACQRERAAKRCNQAANFCSSNIFRSYVISWRLRGGHHTAMGPKHGVHMLESGFVLDWRTVFSSLPLLHTQAFSAHISPSHCTQQGRCARDQLLCCEGGATARSRKNFTLPPTAAPTEGTAMDITQL